MQAANRGWYPAVVQTGERKMFTGDHNGVKLQSIICLNQEFIPILHFENV